MTDNILGQRLRKARRAQDLTQQALGAKADVNYTTISRIESGDYTKVYADTVRDLALALDVSLDWLYGRKEECRV
jgi:transcriptional regulator with XRE-family HTH domain